jgi:hypothetical protein
MPLAGFEPTIPVFKQAKTFHILDRAATVTGSKYTQRYINILTTSFTLYHYTYKLLKCKTHPQPDESIYTFTI